MQVHLLHATGHDISVHRVSDSDIRLSLYHLKISGGMALLLQSLSSYIMLLKR